MERTNQPRPMVRKKPIGVIVEKDFQNLAKVIAVPPKKEIKKYKILLGHVKTYLNNPSEGIFRYCNFYHLKKGIYPHDNVISLIKEKMFSIAQLYKQAGGT